MYGTTSYEKNGIVSNLGGIPIDYKSVDLVQEVIKLTSHDQNGKEGVDAVFDGIGGKSLKSSYEILRSGGRLVAYGGTPTTDLQEWLMMFTLNLVPDNKNFMLYSIQTLKRLKPDWFHEDLILLLNLLNQEKIKPIVAARMPLNQAAQAHELLASGSVKGKIVLFVTIDKLLASWLITKTCLGTKGNRNSMLKFPIVVSIEMYTSIQLFSMTMTDPYDEIEFCRVKLVCFYAL